MVEIFHAPIYRMQGKPGWGDDAILKLHQALNEDPKETFTIRVPPGEMNTNILYDVLKNWNRLGYVVPLTAWIVLQLVMFGPGRLYRKISLRAAKRG
jgi:hypothetical protein